MPSPSLYESVTEYCVYVRAGRDMTPLSEPQFSHTSCPSEFPPFYPLPFIPVRVYNFFDMFNNVNSSFW